MRIAVWDLPRTGEEGLCKLGLVESEQGTYRQQPGILGEQPGLWLPGRCERRRTRKRDHRRRDSCWGESPLRARLYKQSIPRPRSGFDPSDPIITHKHSPGISTLANHLIKVHAETSKTDAADKANTALTAVPERLHQLRSSPV